MIQALLPFSLQTNLSGSLVIVSSGHLRLTEYHLIEWLLVPSTYSFAQSEAGDDSIEPSNLFAYIDADETPKDLHATVEGIAKAKHSHNLAASRNPHDKRIGWRPGGSDSKPSFKHCSGERRDIIKWAAEDAQVALDRAIAVSERIVEEGPSADRGYYRTWFGTYSEARAHTVWSKLRRIKPNLSFLGFTYDCKCNEALPSDIGKHTLQCGNIVRLLINLLIS